MATLKIRTSAPKKWYKIWNNANNGGLSWCINGKVKSTGNPDPVANVLANCVGYANSRFNEIYNRLTGKKGIMKYQLCCNAEDFWTVAPGQGLKRGQTPKAGAIMVWLGYGSAAGHVAIVERVDSKNQVLTSESGYNAPKFWNSVRYKGDGNWGAGAGYKFLGFIYNPAVDGDGKTLHKDVLAVDGMWGKTTTIAMQKWLGGLKKDGIINNQRKSAKKICPAALTKAWQFNGVKGGDPAIKKLQQWLGVKDHGLMTDHTISHLQKKLKVERTGILDKKTVEAFQRFLNKKLK